MGRYTEEEESFIKENAEYLSDKEGIIKFEETFGRPISVDSYASKRRHLGYIKRSGYHGERNELERIEARKDFRKKPF